MPTLVLPGGTPLHAGPPPWWSVQQGTHNAVTCESWPITVCSQLHVGSDGCSSLPDDALWDYTPKRLAPSLNASTPNVRNRPCKSSLKPDARPQEAEAHSAISRWKHICLALFAASERAANFRYCYTMDFML